MEKNAENEKMICTKCGQELKNGAKFCVKCGTRCNETAGLAGSNFKLAIISIVVSSIGIIGPLILSIAEVVKEAAYARRIHSRVNLMRNLFIYFQGIPGILLLIGVLIALIVQNKQKSLMGFLAGLIPCIYLIIMQALGFFGRFFY